MLGMKKFYNVKGSSKSSLNESSSNLFDKLSRRYSVIGNKLLRKSPGRKGHRDVVSGSYNMTGSQSEDLRPEIGLPILISKIDRTDLDTIDRKNDPQSPSASTDSDTDDVFLDATSSFADIKFQFLPEGTSSPNSSYEGSYDLTGDSPKISKSQSAQNLHRTELKVFLKRAPSLEAIEDGESDQCYDFPKRSATLELESSGRTQETTLPESIKERRDSIISGSSASYNCYSIQRQTAQSPTLSQQIAQHLSNLNDNNLEEDIDECDDKPANSNNRRDSLNSNNSSINPEDFDFKSVSLESLNAKNVFLSIDELNELTRQINESEQFNGDIDFEYVDHRDNLKPSERRITLLRNKENNRFIHIGADKKEKLAKKWSSIKHWVGEEKVKLKDVVSRHAALQRVGASGKGDGVDNGAGDSPRCESLEPGSDHYGSVYDTSPSRKREITSEERETPTAGGNSRKTSLHRGLHNDCLEGQNGFEELRRFVKQGGDFGKELAAILQERMEAEQNYSKSLSKMAQKLNKSCRDIPGSIADAWRSVSTEMESRSEVHRQFSASLADEIIKPLKTILDNQHKSRKAIEGNVDKAARLLTEWRTAELKGKKSSHTAARENEKLQDAMLDVRVQRSPSIAILPPGARNSVEKESKDKDCTKLENKRKKAEDAVKRADVEYYQLCIRAERARVDWEIAVLRGSSMLQSLENQRLSHFKEYVKSYHKLSTEMNPVIEQIVQRLEPQIVACNVQKDLAVIKNIRRAAEGPSEQLLPDFYCEHTTLAMNRERRKQSLVKLLQLIKQDLERERKSRSGLKGFSQTINNQDNQNITDKLYHIRSMLTYLEGARYKLQSALLELDHRPRGSHPLAQHIQITRDRTGLQQSILKVPLWLKNDEHDNSSQHISNDDLEMAAFSSDCLESPKPIVIECENELLVQKINARNKILGNGTNGHSETNGRKEGSPNQQKLSESPTCDRGVADGNSNQPDSDFDEFSSDDEGTKSEASKLTTDSSKQPMTVLGRCKALYSYTPKLYDELELFPNDIIEIHHKQDDGWWLGSLRNNVGIFPATYVEEIE